MMKKSNSAAPMNRQEMMAGLFYMVFQLLFLPAMLQSVNAMLPRSLSEAELNFTYYLINFLTMTVLFHDFLGSSLRHAGHHLIDLVQAVILGLAAYYACTFCTARIIDALAPSYSNYNDEAIFAMSRGNAFLMLIGTVVLVPPVEECMYRGLVFRNLYGKNKIAAYVISILVFAIIHILGYIGKYSPLELVMAVLQYLPAGLCLAWSYAKADTIFAPIFVHAAINYITIRTLR